MDRFLVFLFFLILLISASFVYMEVGSSGVSFLGYILGKDNNIGNGVIHDGVIHDSVIYDGVIYVRFVQLVSVFISGSSLSLAGFALQRMLKNPLIDPGITGVLSGSALGYVIAFSFLPSLGLLSLFYKGLLSFIFGLIPGVVLVFISLSSKDSTGIIIFGVILNAFISSLTVLVQSIINPNMLSYVSVWMMGSVGINNLGTLVVYLVVEVVILFFMIAFSRYIDILSIGEIDAHVLGVDVKLWRSVFLIFSIVLSSISVLLTGIVSFVGFIVPNTLTFFMYKFRSINTKDIVFLNFVLGGTFLIFSHMLSRIFIVGFEFPLGVVTGFIGAPVFAIFLSKLIFR